MKVTTLQQVMSHIAHRPSDASLWVYRCWSRSEWKYVAIATTHNVNVGGPLVHHFTAQAHNSFYFSGLTWIFHFILSSTEWHVNKWTEGHSAVYSKKKIHSFPNPTYRIRCYFPYSHLNWDAKQVFLSEAPEWGNLLSVPLREPERLLPDGSWISAISRLSLCWLTSGWTGIARRCDHQSRPRQILWRTEKNHVRRAAPLYSLHYLWPLKNGRSDTFCQFKKNLSWMDLRNTSLLGWQESFFQQTADDFLRS